VSPVLAKSAESLMAYLPAGTKDRMQAVLRPEESMAAFVRQVVLAELTKREEAG